MSYTSPAGNAANLQFSTGYSAPSGSAANLLFIPSQVTGAGSGQLSVDSGAIGFVGVSALSSSFSELVSGNAIGGVAPTATTALPDIRLTVVAEAIVVPIGASNASAAVSVAATGLQQATGIASAVVTVGGAAFLATPVVLSGYGALAVSGAASGNVSQQYAVTALGRVSFSGSAQCNASPTAFCNAAVSLTPTGVVWRGNSSMAGGATPVLVSGFGTVGRYGQSTVSVPFYSSSYGAVGAAGSSATPVAARVLSSAVHLHPHSGLGIGAISVRAISVAHFYPALVPRGAEENMDSIFVLTREKAVYRVAS